MEEVTRKPNFFIVGAPRCGTTAIWQYLKQHPEVFISEWKEPYFFGGDLHFRKPRINREQYLSLFSEAHDEKRLGEASVLYLYSKQSAVEIKEFCPHARIIIMLRNPVDMIYSWHSHLLYVGSEDIADFEAALNATAERKRGGRLPNTNLIDCLFYRDVARYPQQVQRYLDTFGRENVHIIFFDDLQTEQARVYAETLRFLDVNTDFQAEFRVVNSNRGLRIKAWRRFVKNRRAPLGLRLLVPRPLRQRLIQGFDRYNTKDAPRPPMNPELRRRLQVEFAPDVERLSELLGRDLTHWSRDR